MSAAWLVVVDPQRIFAAPGSAWGSPMWADVVAPIRALAAAFGERVIVTRWVAPRERTGSWAAYMEAWPFADHPADHPLFDVVDELADLPGHRVTATTFGKWEVIAPITGPAPHLVLTGVSTDCCVISTALPAADAGATLSVVTDACAGSTAENHAAALHVLSLYPPQITLRSTVEILGERRE
ncbi:MAG: cysteine hydrolase [Actinomycetales bacterium]|nr:cysteine hydrolase [Actinomycetales bacterium]